MNGGEKHFGSLEVLRGVAALSVMIYHNSKTGWLPSGYLAVDMFFMLSGFVIAFSYNDKLRKGMSAFDFIINRYIRLYPMIIAGSIAGLFATVGSSLFHSINHSYSDIMMRFICSILIVPSIFETSFGDQIFPFNTVMWSLFFEIVANIVYGIYIFKCRRSILVFIVISSLIAVATIGPLGGNETQNFWAGFPRVSFGFFGGVLLYRFHSSYRLSHWHMGPTKLSIALLLILAIPQRIEGFQLIPIFLIFSILVLAAASIQNYQNNRSTQKFLGALSYPLYALHRPLFTMLAFVLPKLGLDKEKSLSLFIISTSLIIIIISYWVLKLYDEPFRAYLSCKFIQAKIGNRPPSSVSSRDV